jgi:hypothetical protein
MKLCFEAPPFLFIVYLHAFRHAEKGHGQSFGTWGRRRSIGDQSKALMSQTIVK